MGDDGLNGTGIWAAYLVPVSWYFEIVPQFISNDNAELFQSNTQDDVASVLFVKNLWDLSDSLAIR